MQWTDATSYAQGKRGKVPQTCWSTQVEGARIIVMRGHRYYPNRWIMTCRKLAIEEFDLGSDDLSSEQARDLSVNKVWEVANTRIAELTAISDRAFAAPDLAT